MEIQIQDLVNAIKKEGVDTAKAQADEIIAKAQEEADKIIAKANSEYDKIIKKANTEIETLKASALTMVEHAKRDAILFYKKAVEDELEILLNANIEKVVKSEVLAKLIIAALNEENPKDYIVEVNEVNNGLKGELASKIQQGLEIKANPNIRAGFKLTAKDGSGYIDCSSEELAKILAPFFPEFSL